MIKESRTTLTIGKNRPGQIWKKEKWIITRFPHGVVLNPEECVVDEKGKVKYFETAKKALVYYREHEGEVDDIHHGVEIKKIR